MGSYLGLIVEIMMTKRQYDIILGTVMGDAYIQATGKKNARVRFEHSEKQKDYIYWKWQELKSWMQDKPKKVVRYNPIWKKIYTYYRCQTHSSPVFGKLRRLFYTDNQKIIPENFGRIFRSDLALAVWYMDDGYYYHRDKTAYIYLSKFPEREIKKILRVLDKNFALKPKLEIKRSENINLKFPVNETKKLINLIKLEIISSMRYKLPLPK